MITWYLMAGGIAPELSADVPVYSFIGATPEGNLGKSRKEDALTFNSKDGADIYAAYLLRETKVRTIVVGIPCSDGIEVGDKVSWGGETWIVEAISAGRVATIVQENSSSWKKVVHTSNLTKA